MSDFGDDSYGRDVAYEEADFLKSATGREWLICGNIWDTVFRRINAPGTEAQNEPLSLSDCNEIHSGIP